MTEEDATNCRVYNVCKVLDLGFIPPSTKMDQETVQHRKVAAIPSPHPLLLVVACKLCQCVL